LPGDPGHEIWKRDFEGACGLFGIVVEPCTMAGLEAMLNGMKHFSMGYSWGGFESLVLPMRSGVVKNRNKDEPGQATMRIHAGLEDVEDLIDDFEQGFERLKLN
jgi:cystathionine beta-lyase